MSGLASLVLTASEISSLDQQFKRMVQTLLKLSTRSPAPLVHFISGTLPGTAILHLRQLSLFGMICRLPGDPLHHHAWQALLTLPPSANSWFTQVRDIFLQYRLPHPLLLLENPPTKESFKKLTKAKVLDYWEDRLRREASFLPSLEYLHPQFLSLKTPHMLLTSAGNKPYEVAKARIQLLFLSNQYPCGSYTRHWTPENRDGLCTFLQCREAKAQESPEHILLKCPEWSLTREKMYLPCLSMQSPIFRHSVTSILFSGSTNKQMQFFLDCSVLPEVIKSVQIHGDDILGDLFYLYRTCWFSLHKQRLKNLGNWNFR